MSFRDNTELAQFAPFVARVQAAMVKSAIAVNSEDPATVGYATRVQWATQVLRDPQHYASRMAYGVAANPTITIESGDNDIEFTVNGVWNAYAGVIVTEAVE